MNERPPRPPFSATFVVWASHRLTLAEKVIWYHDWALDQGGTDGAYISARSMGERLAMSDRTVEDARGRLRRLGLHVRLARPDARNSGWVATLPATCLPRGPAAGKQAVLLASELDRLIEAIDSGPRRADSPPMDGESVRSRAGAGYVAGRTVSGSVVPPTSVSQGETQLPPVVRQVGVGAYAPKAEDGGPEKIAAVLRRMGTA